jgi:hypothetical protein
MKNSRKNKEIFYFLSGGGEIVSVKNRRPLILFSGAIPKLGATEE